jgi:asparagine synthase (glutamine-hydrolysing)
MCGIAVILSKSEINPVEEERLRHMLHCMNHRGPDTEGVYIDRTVGLAMNRLSIVGIETGNQPIFNENSSIVLVCNGEIYNHKKLRKQLLQAGHSFSTDSDAEVIVHLYEQYGKSCVEFLEGIFAFALWDKEKQLLLVARDRMGVKPLYYVDTGTHLLFASETQALFTSLNMDLNFDMQGFSDYHTFRFTPGNHTIFRDIKKLKPAQYLVIQQNRINSGFYWIPKLDQSVKKENYSIQNKVHTLRSLIVNAVKSQFAYEVKPGILLSGGLDSSALLAIHHMFYQEPIDTFTVSFEPPRIPIDVNQYSEIEQAANVAKAFSSNHIAEVYSAQQALEALPSIIGSLSEPIADPTAIPLWFVCRLAHQAGCRVVFSGEGLDELFNGYKVYKQTHWLRVLQLAPRTVRQFGLSLFNQFNLPGQSLLKKTLSNTWEWYQGVGGLFSSKEKKQLLQKHIWEQIQNQNPQAQVEKIMYPVRDGSILQQMTHFDVFAWLPENTFAKSDNISMAHSLELRVPFVDNGIVEYALQMEDNLKLRGNTGKWIVKQSLKDLLPSWIIKRRKAGFPVPLTAWIFNEWRDFVLTTLLDPNAYTRDFYKKEEITKLYNTPKNGQGRAARLLWALLTLELWCQAQVNKKEKNSLFLRKNSVSHFSTSLKP